jgi:alkylhydroperoxidase family enzyme
VRDGDNGAGKLAAVTSWREASVFDERERLALELAERMTITGQRVDDELFGRLRARFGEPELVELAAAIALENFRSRLNPALGVEAQGFCLLPGTR